MDGGGVAGEFARFATWQTRPLSASRLSINSCDVRSVEFANFRACSDVPR
jgi:hypothetical protein